MRKKIKSLSSENDKKILEDWYIEFYKIMRKISYDIIGDYDVANDMVNEAFVKIIENFERINYLNCHERAVYFVSIIRNISIDYLRKKNKELKKVSNYINDDEFKEKYIITYGNINEYEKIEKSMDIKRALDKLSERDKLLLICRYGFGMNSNEISKMLGIKELNVNSYIRRAKNKFAKIIIK